MNILAIDPATLTGYALKGISGTQSFKLRSNESKGLKFLKFKKFLKTIIDNGDIDIVVYEKPAGRHYNGIRSSANFEGIILSVCEELNIAYRDYSPTEIKRFAKEQSKYNGRMNKEAMFVTAVDYFVDIEVYDDNHADALWLYELAFSEIN